MTKKPGVLRASAFVLEDDEGRDRGGLSLNEGSEPQLCLKDESGRTRVLADIHESNPRLMMTDETGVTRVGLDGDVRIGLDFDQENGDAIISLVDENQVTRLSLSVSPTRGPTVTIWGRDETSRLHLEIDDTDAGSVLLAEAQGKVGFMAGIGNLMLLKDGKLKTVQVGDGE